MNKFLNYLQELLVWLAFVLLTFAIAAVGNFYTGDAQVLYENLALPRFAPPADVFAIVWRILYILIATAAFLTFKHCKKCRCKNTVNYFLNIALGAVWVFVFFGLQLFTAAALLLGFLVLHSIYLAANFYKCRPVCGYMLIPYIIWLCFSLYLNSGIAALN